LQKKERNEEEKVKFSIMKGAVKKVKKTFKKQKTIVFKIDKLLNEDMMKQLQEKSRKALRYLVPKLLENKEKIPFFIKAFDFMLFEVDEQRGITPTLKKNRKPQDLWDKLLIERSRQGEIKFFNMQGGRKEIEYMKQAKKFVDMFSYKFNV